MVAARYIVQGAAALQLFDDVFAKALMLRGDDAHAFAAVQTGGEIVQRKAVDPGANEADDHHPERVHRKGRAADEGAGYRYGGADVEVQILVDDLGQDVQAAGGGVDVEEDGLRDAEDEDKAQQIEPDVSHKRRLAGLHKAAHRQDLFPNLDERTQDECRVHGLGTELLANQEPRHNEQGGVDDGDHQGHLHRYARQAEEAGNHHRQTAAMNMTTVMMTSSFQNLKVASGCRISPTFIWIN